MRPFRPWQRILRWWTCLSIGIDLDPTCTWRRDRVNVPSMTDAHEEDRRKGKGRDTVGEMNRFGALTATMSLGAATRLQGRRIGFR